MARAALRATFRDMPKPARELEKPKVRRSALDAPEDALHATAAVQRGP